MYNITEMRTLLRNLLTNFLMSMASGVSIDAFLESSDLIREFLRVFDELQESNSSLNAQINNATQIMKTQEQALQQRANLPLPEILSLLSRAMELLGGEQPAQDSPLTFQDIFGRTTGTEYTVGTVEVEVQVPAPDEDDEEVDDENEEDYDGDVPADDTPVEDISYEEVDEEDFDLEDEDLDDTAQPVSPDASEDIVKNPEITEDFTGLDNSHMVTFIGVRYSHLPYHYMVDNVRYKLVINGSQIVSTRV